MKVKKFLFAILATAMVLGMMSLPAFADEEASEIDTEVSEVSYVASIGENSFETLEAAINAAQPGNTVTLLADADLSTATDVEITKAVTLDLDKKTLNITNVGKSGCIVVKNQGDLTIRNGKVTANDTGRVTSSVIAVTTGGSVTLDNVDFATSGAALYPSGDAARVSVINDSKIFAPNSYAVATNANSVENYNVIIELKNSTLTGLTPVLINVPGTLTIDSCTITGTMQGVVVRGGTAEIKNSTVVQDYPDDDFEVMAHYFDDKNWGSGNMVNLSAITIGNKDKQDSTSYQYPSNVSITNSNVEVRVNGEVSDAFPCVYAWPMEKEGQGVTLKMQDNTLIGGTYPQIVYGNPNATVNGDVAIVNGKVYATLPAAIDAAKAGDTVTLLADVTVDENYSSGASLEIRKALTIDGQGQYTITCEKKFGIRIFGGAEEEEAMKVVLKDVTVTNANSYGRAVETRGGNVELELDNATITTTGGGNTQVFTVGGNRANATTVTIKNGSKLIASQAGYGIITFNPVNMTIDNSEVSGYGALYFKGPDSSAGSAGSTINIVNGARVSSAGIAGESNTFGTLVFQENNITVNVEDSTVEATADPNDNPETPQAAIMFSSYANSTGVVVNISGDSCVNTVNENAAFVRGEMNQNTIAISGGTFSCDVSQYLAPGYDVEEVDGRFTVKNASAITWTTAADAGYYMNAETKVGIMRFLFAVDVADAKIEEVGIKYSKAKDIAEEVNGTHVSKFEELTAFSGDVTGIPENEDSSIYAVAYVKIGNEYKWSAPQNCSVNWTKLLNNNVPAAADNEQ